MATQRCMRFGAETNLTAGQCVSGTSPCRSQRSIKCTAISIDRQHGQHVITHRAKLRPNFVFVDKMGCSGV